MKHYPTHFGSAKGIRCIWRSCKLSKLLFRWKHCHVTINLTIAIKCELWFVWFLVFSYPFIPLPIDAFSWTDSWFCIHKLRIKHIENFLLTIFFEIFGVSKTLVYTVCIQIFSFFFVWYIYILCWMGQGGTSHAVWFLGTNVRLDYSNERWNMFFPNFCRWKN